MLYRDNPKSFTYLSPEIQNEFISILASSVRNWLVQDIIQSKYYNLLVDSTPDLAHRERLSQVIRFLTLILYARKSVSKKCFWVS